MTRILIVSSLPIFGEGIETLLSGEAGLEIVGRENDPKRAIECLNQLGPDVVILDDAPVEGDWLQTVLGIMHMKPTIKVITVSRGDNTIALFLEKRRVVQGVADLIQVIKENSGQPEWNK